MTSLRSSIVVVALGACGPPEERALPQDASAQSATTPEASAASGPSSKQQPALVGSIASAKPSKQPTPLWLVPEGESSEPTLAEWSGASTFNGAASATREARCAIAAVREWVRLSCEGGDFLNTLFASTKDFAQRRGDRGASTLVVRLRRGDLVVASLVVDGKDVAARVAWPGQAAGPTVAEAWRSSGGGRVVVPTDPEPIPLPSTPSSRPRPGDWLAATPVNTAPPGRRAASCASLVLHDWLHWACSGVGVSVRQSEGLGVAGSDSFQTVGFELAEGDVRLRPGMKASLTIRLTVDGPVAKLQVNWPANEPKPTEISFETAPN